MSDAVETALALPEHMDWLEIEERVKELYAGDINDRDWQIFKGEAQALGLNPIKREYIPLLIKAKKTDRNGNVTQMPEYRGYTTLAGLITLAERSGRLESIDGPYFAGTDSGGDFVEYWPSDWNRPDAARVTVWRKDTSRPTTAVVTMKRARTIYDSDKRARVIAPGLWSSDPAIMLGVRAMTDALKKSGLIAATPLVDRIALESGEVLGSGEDRSHAGRRLHAIAAARGLDHEDARAVAQHIDPEAASLGDLAARDLHAEADYIDAAPAETLTTVTGRHESEIIGDPFDPAPEPDPKDPNGITPEQTRWLSLHRSRVIEEKLTEAELDRYDRLEEITAAEARDLIFTVSKLLEADPWRSFWEEARAAGFMRASDIVAACAGILPGEFPDDPGEAMQWLRVAQLEAATQKPAGS